MTALSVSNISKSYDGTIAAADISFSIGAGKILAVCGENGAGKSTLMKILSGATLADSGEIRVDDDVVHLSRPADAMALGLRTVYQELSLLPHISVAENMMMGRMPTREFGFVVDWPAANQRAAEMLAELGFTNINPSSRVETLSVAQQQIVEIAKALIDNPRFLILDEPTAVLSGSETQKLFTAVRRLAAAGKTILYISHRLEEIFELADEVVILKDGRSVLQGPVASFDQAQLIQAMVGRPLAAIFPPRSTSTGPEVLRVSDLGRDTLFSNISFSVHAGEIVGMFGLVGSGRTEVAEAIFGSHRADHGDIRLRGDPVNVQTPADAVRNGIVMLTEDRKGNGLALEASVLDNIALASFDRVSRAGVIEAQKLDALVDEKSRELSIRPTGSNRPVRQLSGGNQQKVVIAKWLLVEDTKLFIFDEPTRGVDIATKVEIYQMIADLAASGVAVLLISSEMPEVLGLSDRLLVMREGRLVAELPSSEFSPELVFAHAAGLDTQSHRSTLH